MGEVPEQSAHEEADKAARNRYASRLWHGRAPKYRHLLVDEDVKRWYDNICRGSRITADVYLRHLGLLCAKRGLGGPKELLKLTRGESDRRAYNFLIDIVSSMERGERREGTLRSSLRS